MLRAQFLEKEFENPIVLASGILGVTAASMNMAVQNGCGGVTIKSLSKEPRTGHPNPTMTATDVFFINAVGLSNPGIKEGNAELKKFKELSDAPLLGSIFAGTPDEFAEVAELISEAPIDFLEVNISCPNVSSEFGTPFAFTPDAITTITRRVKERTKVPIIIKLSPQAWNIAELAKIAEDAGADALNIGNTINGMIIDVQARMPLLHNKQGGISGPALLPITLNAVYQAYKAVNIPIIGTGGITTGEDAIAMIMAGAKLLGVGSAVYYRGEHVFQKITDEMKKIMREEEIYSLDSIIGCAHDNGGLMNDQGSTSCGLIKE